MLKQYETVFILTPVLSDAQAKETADKFLDLLKNNSAEIVNFEDWGLKKLAYPIKHKNSGFYYLVEFKAEGALIEKLEVEYKRDERIIRFLSFRLDKHAIAYSLRKRNKRQEVATEVEKVNVEQAVKMEE